jgi:hypothetical protein
MQIQTETLSNEQKIRQNYELCMEILRELKNQNKEKGKNGKRDFEEI